jgi:tRNA nucleotidyltransferase (CCA-adding enzyme)
VTGNDLIALGYEPGPEIGKALRALLDNVIRDPDQNTREQLLERARELKP